MTADTLLSFLSANC